MCASSPAWGTPDFGQMLNRDRVVERIAQSGDRPCVLFGPSGCGKSVAAAQYALSSRRRTIWLDAGGQFLSGRQLAQTTLRALGEVELSRGAVGQSDSPALVDLVDAVIRSIPAGDRATDGVLIVVDDLGAPATPEEVSGFRALARGLWRIGSRVMITARGISGWSSDVLRECALIGPEELALTGDEAEDYLRYAGLLSLLSESDELRLACGGHPAFFVVMASQATEHGLATCVARTPSLDAWLHSAMVSQTTVEQKRAIVAAVLMRTGDDQDLLSLGIKNPIDALDGLAIVMPLAGCTRTADGGRSFRIHQLLDGYLVDVQRDDLGADSWLFAKAIELLSSRRDFPRAAELLSREGAPEQAISWLALNGNDALADGHYLSLGRLISCIPVATLMTHPGILLIWAEVCAETGQIEDAFAKCRAARTLAEHEGDDELAFRALALSARYAGRANRIDEAEKLAGEILSAPRGQVLDVVIAEALLCRAQNAVMRAEYTLASELLRKAIAFAESSSSGQMMMRSASQALALVPALAWGDHLASSRMLAPSIVEGQQYLTDRIMLKGNAATCLCEAGRLSRCEQLLISALAESRSAGLDVYSGAYLAVLGCVKVGRGESEQGIATMNEGIAISIRGGDERGADQSRVYLAVALRAAGELTESLVVAERAFERLTIADSCSFRKLAALEVAASLLALGDASGAVIWAGAVAEEGFDGNRFHALRAAMILAEADRRMGRLEEAVARILAESEYLLSENPNWQVAMYCRAFPSLLGLVATALTPSRLPSHLLRMIPPENAEQILTETKAFLETALWRELGDRLIGQGGMDQYIARDGLPLCHARLFGGLEVSIGNRTVRERDWKKRKARLLFAMLATKRGRDVPRDQVIDYLWPDMDEERAKNNLYVAWSMMKSVLGGKGSAGTRSPYVENTHGVCRIVRDMVRSDIDEFEEALVAARDAETAGHEKDALSAYERIANLYRGDLLPGDVYDDWFSSLRDHYRSEFADAMLRASQLLIDAEDPGNALLYVRRAIQMDSLREDLNNHGLRCMIDAGQRSSAIEMYFQFRDRLSDELGLDPSPETRALYDQILAMEDQPIRIPFEPLSE